MFLSSNPLARSHVAIWNRAPPHPFKPQKKQMGPQQETSYPSPSSQPPPLVLWKLKLGKTENPAEKEHGLMCESCSRIPYLTYFGFCFCLGTCQPPRIYWLKESTLHSQKGLTLVLKINEYYLPAGKWSLFMCSADCYTVTSRTSAQRSAH